MEKDAFLLFPTVILKYILNRQFTEKEMSIVKNQIELSNGGNSTSSNKRVLEHPDMIDLKNYIQSCLDDYFIEVYNPARPEEVKLKITQSWLNYSRPGQFHHTHMHPNSIISGCLYINADENLDVIEFKQYEPRQFFIEPKETNFFNTQEFTVRVATGHCILFPSMMHHAVPEVSNKETRISLSFNSFYEGTIGLSGNGDGVNYLEINNIK